MPAKRPREIAARILREWKSGHRTADALLAEAGVEPDPSVREEQYQEIERLILGDWVVVPLWHSRSYELVRPYVKGYEITPIGIPIFREVSIAR